MLVRPEAYPRGEHLKGARFNKLVGLLANIGQGWKGFPGTNALAYRASLSVTKKKGFKTLIPVRLISHEESFHMRSIVKNETVNNNLNKFASPSPVNLFGGDIDGRRVYDVAGNVWRHSVSVLTVMALML